MQRIKGFTMVELLVVLIILAILVAVAAPMYFGNVDRAKASEAVAAAGTIKQTLRDYFVSHKTYFDITTGNIKSALPTSVTAKVPTPASAGVSVDLGVAQYFSNASYTVSASGTPAWNTNITPGTPGAPVDFLVNVDGSASVVCASASTDCAVRNTEVANYRLQMDNSGRTFVSYNSGTNWSAY